MSKCVPELYRKCSVVFSMITWHCTHVHLYPHVLNVLVQYLTCTSHEHWVRLPNSLEHGVTLSWCNMSDAISYMRLAKCKQNKYLCCESQPHTHTHPVTPTHAHTHAHMCIHTGGILTTSSRQCGGVWQDCGDAPSGWGYSGPAKQGGGMWFNFAHLSCAVFIVHYHTILKANTCPAHSQWLVQFSTIVDTVKCSYQNNDKSRYCQIEAYITQRDFPIQNLLPC